MVILRVIFCILLLAYLKVDSRKILGKFPGMRKIPLQKHGMAAFPKIQITQILSLREEKGLVNERIILPRRTKMITENDTERI